MGAKRNLCSISDSRMSLLDRDYPNDDIEKKKTQQPIDKKSSQFLSSIDAYGAESNKVLIECSGATRYHPDSFDVSAGVKFVDRDDPARGLEIISHPIYGPNHVAKRWVKKEDAHLIRRCQSCQDYTIRMRRREGPDLYIPPRHGSRPARSSRPTHPARQTQPAYRFPASSPGNQPRNKAPNTASIFIESVS